MYFAKNRLSWFSCCKFLAILAVVLVHCGGYMYTSNYIFMATSYSVTLFILLSGFGAGLSTSEPSFKHALTKMLPMIRAYIIATLICTLLNGELSLEVLFKNVVGFTAQGTFYFLFFFFQLKLVTPPPHKMVSIL